MATPHQKLPNGEAREALRGKGQFWTPAWVAEAMAAYALADNPPHIFDPAVGEGAFFRAVHNVTQANGQAVEMLGMETDALALEEAEASGLSANDLRQVRIGDFVLSPPRRDFEAIIANPPYIRHHRLSSDTKAILQRSAADFAGLKIDGRAGLHVYFLIQALQLLAPGGRLAFILPADVAEGKSAPDLWRWITGRYCLEAVVTFAPDATPFPGVDTNALVFLIRNAPPTLNFTWARVRRAATPDLKAWIVSCLQGYGTTDLEVHTRQVAEGLKAGLSRPFVEESASGWMLGDFASVVRGVATGANDFFLLTRAQTEELQLPDEFLLPAVGRTRDVNTEVLLAEHIAALDAAGRPTQLLSLPSQPLEAFAPALRAYLEQGRQMGLPDKALIQQRSPWYKMEKRRVPPFLFAYLGRRSARFIRNEAGAIPLTGFLCVYPHQEDGEAQDQLWTILRHPETVENLARVGKSYGSGAIKVEPRALERLPIPEHVLQQSGLEATHLFAGAQGFRERRPLI